MLRLRVDVSEYGLRGTGTVIVDRRTGQYARHFDVGPATDGEGFDGTNEWMSDASGAHYPQGNADTRARIRRWSLVLRRLGTQEVPANFCTRVGEAQECVAFGDVRRFNSVLLPFAITIRDQQGTRLIRVRRVETLQKAPPRAFTPPPLPRDFGISALSGVADAPLLREQIGTRALPLLVVQARINGGPAMRFLVDTGGQNVLAQTAAQKLHLRTAGAVNIGGAGAGTVIARYTGVREVTIDSAFLQNQPFLVLPLGNLLPDIDGVIGAEVFSRFAVRVDYRNHRLQFSVQPTRAWLRHIRSSPIAFDKNMPDIAGAVNGTAGRFTLDTGSVGGLDLYAPFIRMHNLAALDASSSRNSKITGVGGSVKTSAVEFSRLQLGNSELTNVSGGLTRKGGGVTDDPTIAGNVGELVFRRFGSIVFDYRNGSMEGGR